LSSLNKTHPGNESHLCNLIWINHTESEKERKKEKKKSLVHHTKGIPIHAPSFRDAKINPKVLLHDSTIAM
jgi:hypothetical protein